MAWVNMVACWQRGGRFLHAWWRCLYHIVQGHTVRYNIEAQWRSELSESR